MCNLFITSCYHKDHTEKQ